MRELHHTNSSLILIRGSARAPHWRPRWRDPQAAREILTALRDPAATGSWFPAPLPGLGSGIRLALLDAAIERTASFGDLRPAAVAAARVTTALARDWRDLLLKAFPAPPTDLDDDQRAYLRALAGNDALWDGQWDISAPFGQLRLPATREACRALAEAPDAATWLAAHAVRIRAVRRQALADAELAVSKARRTGPDHAGTPEPPASRAKASSRLSSALADLGRQAEAAAAARDAEHTWQQLAATHPGESGPELLAAQVIGGTRLLAAADQAGARSAAQRAAASAQAFAGTAPPGYRLAGTLADLGRLAAALSWSGQALTATQAAVDMYQQLGNDIFLAPALADLALRLRERGQAAQAVATMTDAAHMLRRVAQANRFAARGALGDLAIALTQLFRSHSEAGEQVHAQAVIDQAVTVSREVVTMVRPLAVSDVRFDPALAQALAGLAHRLVLQGSPQQARPAAAESVQVYADLASDLPEVFAGDHRRTADLLASIS